MLQKNNTSAKIDPKLGPAKYPGFSKFAKNVLEVAEKKINAKTDTNFTYTTKKAYNKVTGLEFRVASHLKAVKPIFHCTSIFP